MTKGFRSGSPDALFADRRDWLRLDVMENACGGWAVVLVLDEGYDQPGAEYMRRHFAQLLASALIDVYLRDPERGSPAGWFGGSASILHEAAASYRTVPSQRVEETT